MRDLNELGVAQGLANGDPKRSPRAISAIVPWIAFTVIWSSSAAIAHASDEDDAAAIEAPAFLPLAPYGVGLTLGSGAGEVDAGTAAAQRMGTTGATLHIGLVGELFSLLTTALSFGTIFADDYGAFTETVVEDFNEDHPFEAESSLNVTIIGLSAGLRTPSLCLHDCAGLKLATFAYARYGHAFLSGGRSISRCIDCSSYDLKLQDGSFLESGLDLGFRLGIGMSLFGGYRGYFHGASPLHEIQIGYGIWFG